MAAITRLTAEGSAIASRLALARISEDLIGDPEAREQFIEDPVGWIRTTYNVEPSSSDREFLADYQQLMADGQCCTGCTCHPAEARGQGNGSVAARWRAPRAEAGPHLGG
jgi:hypothetical protein